MANSEQSAFWNGVPGQNWVTYQSELDQLISGIADLLVTQAAPASGETVLDIGCGAGASSFQLAEAVAPSGRVHGVDISALLLDRANQRRNAAGIENVSFALADAQQDPLGTGYDLAVSRFGVMFFSEPATAFRHIAAAMRPGGRMAFVAWAGPEHNPWFALPQKVATERLGPVAPADPTAPGPMAFRDAERVVGILREAGLADCRAETVDTELHHPGGLDAAMTVVAHVGPIARMLREKNGTDEDLAAILATVRDSLMRYVAEDGIRVPARVHLFSASVR